MPLRSVLVACIRDPLSLLAGLLTAARFVPSRTPRISMDLAFALPRVNTLCKNPQWSNHPVPDQSPHLRIALRREWKTRTRQDVHPLLSFSPNISDSKLLHVGG